MTNLRIKRVLRFDEIQGHYRLFRVMWEWGEPGDGSGYSVKFSVALTPSLARWYREGRYSWFVHLLGLRLHYCRSYAGRFV